MFYVVYYYMIFHTHYYIILTCYLYTRYIAEYFG